MNIEYIKSGILTILVGMSLLLTLALWTYQPAHESLNDTNYIDETVIDGEEKTLTSLLQPSEIIAHDGNSHSSLDDREDELRLFEEIRTWQVTQTNPEPQVRNRQLAIENSYTENIEIRFPLEVPESFITQMFSLVDTDSTWDQTFNRMFLFLSQSEQTVIVKFVSDEHGEQITGQIESRSAFDRIDEVINQNSNIPLSQVTLENGKKLYLTTEEKNVDSYLLLTREIDIDPMINLLFSNPDLVSRQGTINRDGGTVYYNDGTRRIETTTVFRDDRVMEYVNPLSSQSNTLSRSELIRQSLQNTNDYKGWTDDYQVDEITESMNRIRYRMYYNELPVFETQGNATMIEEEWENNELHILKRPLFKTERQIEPSSVTVEPAEEVYEFLRQIEDKISMGPVQNIRLGYQLNTNNENVLELEPEWHINYNGRWRPFSFFEEIYSGREVE
ncbi:hypothetical protein CEY16_11805 [Halalkalibacillus sediminis]|uniref:Regulatory protein YycH domain-containing protein n=1 Tax=Halalkalibacillus sediminis TaxID=2018042 RepID=A0A2I0QSX0_9BACI|nr:two-component system activity regulator YycH [Halalkalibacillus sediminis]PKR77408.1 hypothetical protein CEY16_11805 [Halalkalibacillus sediminis]